MTGLLLVLVGCGRTPPPSAELRLETLDLREGQELGAGRDADPVAPGFQLDIAIRLTDVNGTEVPIGSATLEWREEPDVRFGEKTEGQIDGAMATFTRLTLPASQLILRMEATEKDGPRKVTIIRRVRLSFDDSQPVVTGWRLPADANGDGILNIAELAAGPVVLEIDAIGMAGGRAKVLVRDTGVELGSAEIEGEDVAVTLEQLDRTGERNIDFRIVLTNALGNTSEPSDVNAYGRFALDAVAPTVTLLAPSAPVLGLASDGDPAAAGFQLLVSARTSADVGEEGLSFSFSSGGAEGITRHVTPVDNEAHELFTLDEDAEHALTFTVVATDRAGNLSPPRMHDVLVDLVPPVIASIASPTPGATYGDTEVSVEATVGGAEGRSLEVFRRQGGTRTRVGALPITAGNAQGTLSFAPGTFDVEVEVADGAGNRAVAEVLGITVNSVGCAIQITSPAARPMLYGLAHDQDAAAAGLQTEVEGTTPDCAGRQVSLSRSGGAIEATTTAAEDGSFSLPVSLAHGEATRLTVSVADPYSVITTDFVDVSVDLVAPAVEALSPDAGSFAFVAPTNVNLGAAGYFVDEVPGGDAQASIQVTVSGEVGDAVFAVYAGAIVSPVHTLTATTQTFDVALELPHGSSGTLEFVAEDAAGNRESTGRETVVDVIAPATPTVSANITNTRRATVDVSWSASGDDGEVGAVAGYDFRYSTNAVLEFGIETEEQFFASEGPAPLSKRVDPGLLPAGTLSRTLTLPPFAEYSFHVRAVDEVGNYSAFVLQPMTQNLGTSLELPNPGVSTRYGIRFASGDLDGDGINDLVVGDDGAQVVYVYRGGPTLGSEPPMHTLPNPGTGAHYFGTSQAVGNFDGAAGLDLFVGASTWSSNRGRVLLYLATASGLPTTPSVELRGEIGVGGVFGSHVKTVPDLNGDGLDEVMVVASRGDIGHVYLYFGRSASDWGLVATAVDPGDSSLYVPVEAADVIFQGPPPGGASPNSDFGRNAVFELLGDLTADGIPELAIAASLGEYQAVYVYDGASVLAKAGEAPGGRLVQTSEALSSITSPSDSKGAFSFGFQLVGGVDLVGGSGPDLVVAYPRSAKLFVYEGMPGGVFVERAVLGGEAQGMERGSYFGYTLDSGDLNGDGKVDLVVGGNPTSGSSSAWGLYHSQNQLDPFESVFPGFNMTRQRGGLTRGLAMHVADVTGDGLLDVIVSDPYDGNGNVYVRH